LAIDEFPVLFVAGACANGETTLRGASELRHKESDRLAVMAQGLQELGVAVTEYPDGLRVRGGAIGGGRVDSDGDHRVAMAFAVASAVAEGTIEILRTEQVATSFPDFVSTANARGLALEVMEASSDGR
jgi:3-phosphoshikimate 1-carboxyvinyltransferase